ncbi:hypothetical protein CMI42_00570 [Candidatus Pacearchaeota archaeon]|nr:hypothetical protein [Candidatus Pacearchaeota archaeon]|tara:strand:- start:553 stop:1752 length:1200 start_codon:yes stop_codon:yes gene_type:complete
MINSEIIKSYALKNAIEHNGKAQQGSVIAGLFNHGLTKENIKDHIKEISKIIKQINHLPSEKQKELFKDLEKNIGKRKIREGLTPLKGTKKPVIMRFAPSPSGPLHIGHALTGTISYLYVEKYKGRFIIRIEDTNPEKIYPPAYKMIKEESLWIWGNKIKFIIQSERLPIYYKYVNKLLKLNKVYVCTCNPEEFKALIKKSKPCPCRNLKQSDQASRWNNMLDKKGYNQGEAVLRFKSNLKNKNPALRDFPLARINTSPHPIQKNKYRVWPLMTLSVTVDDIESKMTHIIRAKDHRDNTKKQKMIHKVLKKKYPVSYFQGKINLKDIKLSSTAMKEEIESKKYTGWDDPRLFTLASLKKQGITPKAIHKLAEQIGLNEVDKTLGKKELMELLNNFNKQT